jgi:hypothetical protein
VKDEFPGWDQLTHFPHPNSPDAKHFDWAHLGLPNPGSAAGRDFNWASVGLPHPDSPDGRQCDWRAAFIRLWRQKRKDLAQKSEKLERDLVQLSVGLRDVLPETRLQEAFDHQFGSTNPIGTALAPRLSFLIRKLQISLDWFSRPDLSNEDRPSLAASLDKVHALPKIESLEKKKKLLPEILADARRIHQTAKDNISEDVENAKRKGAYQALIDDWNTRMMQRHADKIDLPAGAAAEVPVVPAAAPRPEAQKPEEIVTPAIDPVKTVVVAKKPQNGAKRQKVVLSIDRDFDGKGVLTVARAGGDFKFFDQLKDGKEKPFNGAGEMEFDGKDLKAKVSLFVEGTEGSPKLESIQLTLTLKDGTKKKAKPATAKITVAEVTLDICKRRTSVAALPDAFSEADKISPGRLVLKQVDNRHSRAMLIVRPVKPKNFPGQLTLSQINTGAGKLKLFDASAERPKKGQAALPANQKFAISKVDPKSGKTFFVEGDVTSGGLRDIQYQIGIDGLEANCDHVSVTVLEAHLDICEIRTQKATDPPKLSATDKLNPGRFLQVQDAKNKARRAILIVSQVKPPAFVGKVAISPNDKLKDKVKLFTHELPAVAPPVEAGVDRIEIATGAIPALGSKYFVEGAKLSKVLRDTGINLDIDDVEDEADRVNLTVVSQIDIVLDQDKNHAVDENEPVADFVRFGIWDNAFDGAGNVLNGDTEITNFVGSDFRRFYFRVHDPLASTKTINVSWKTLKQDKSDDDAPASQVITLQETAAGSKIFVSKAVMLVTDKTDRDQPTHSGMAAPLPDPGVRKRGKSNHRLRLAKIDGFVKAQYQRPAGAPLATTVVPIFNRDPDERMRINVAVINYNNSATAAYISGQFEHANNRWNQVGIQIDAGAAVNRPIPPGALNGAGLYDGALDNPSEVAALADLIPVSVDNTLTVVFVPLTGNNAYTTVFKRTLSALGDRTFIFVNTTLALTDETLAHELHHALFNRGDVAVPQQFYTFNTTPPAAFGIPLPDSRVYRRIQNMHAADPDNDPPNDNILNWAKRTRGARFPIAPGGNSAPTATTGNKFAVPF